ncbi:phage tail tube protein [Megasphaera massiliensis]|uniref:phage tail tube protein n=1 Tax=Megasphaera massiliensis TaxID=1232428 RepID=UPI000404057B|nr:phage major tail protein, TP901-1 family [Megasphaera massiliensis]
MATRTYAKPTDTGAIATVGKDYLIYLNTGTSEATPTWTLLGGQRSGDLSRKADSIDTSNKTSGGWKSTLAGLREWSIDLESVVILNDAGALFLEDAFNDGQVVQVKFEYPDGQYRSGWAAITDLSLSTKYDDAATIKGTLSGNGPLSELQPAPAK